MGAAGIPNPELIGQVNYFTNDFDTETTGFDLVATYSTVLFGADADISAAWNHTETEVTNSGAVTVASKVKRLEEGLPEDRMTITVAQTWSDKVSSFVRANMYGEYYAVHADWFGTDSDAEWTVDASVSIDLTDNFYVSASGDLNLTGSLKISNNLTVANNTTTNLLYTDNIQTRNGTVIDFRHQDASVIMRVDTDDARVGIGVATPTHKLSVNSGTTNVVAKFQS